MLTWISRSVTFFVLRPGVMAKIQRVTDQILPQVEVSHLYRQSIIIVRIHFPRINIQDIPEQIWVYLMLCYKIIHNAIVQTAIGVHPTQDPTFPLVPRLVFKLTLVLTKPTPQLRLTICA